MLHFTQNSCDSPIAQWEHVTFAFERSRVQAPPGPVILFSCFFCVFGFLGFKSRSKLSFFQNLKYLTYTIDMCLIFYQCVSPCLKLIKKLKLRLYDAILALSKNKRAFFGFFRLFSAFKCEVFEITLSSDHSF